MEGQRRVPGTDRALEVAEGHAVYLTGEPLDPPQSCASGRGCAVRNASSLHWGYGSRAFQTGLVRGMGLVEPAAASYGVVVHSVGGLTVGSIGASGGGRRASRLTAIGGAWPCIRADGENLLTDAWP
jgi:hypothetical protein